LAEKNISEAIQILEEAQDYYPICVYLISMADIYLSKGDDKTALNYTSRSLRLAEQYQLKEQISDASLKLSKLYEREGNTSEAFRYYKNHIAYRDSITNIKTVERLADLRTNYEVSQKQVELDRANKEKKNQRTLAISLFIILALTIGLFATLYWFYKYKSNEKMRSHEQELLRTQLEIQEQTFRNISQEIHDNIGQVLTLAKLNLNTITNHSVSEDINNKLTNSKDLITKAIQDLRDLSKSLNTEFISEAGLLKSIEYELELLRRTGSIQIITMQEGEYYALPQQKELILFRIFQEVLNNIMKHSQATEIKVILNFQPHHFSLEILDNGDGFNSDEVEQNGQHGLGIKNMQNRSKIIGANFTINSQPGKGTTVRIDLPVSQQ
jgi:two-component system, NarL family, sensor kinase